RGWYADSNLTTPFDFSTTAGLVDITVYAKWESHDHKVTFVDADGSPLALDGSDEHGVENGGVFNFSGLTIAGLRFQAGLLNDAVRGAFVGWDYLPAGSTTKQAFPQDTKIYKDYTLYARWKTEGLYAYYHDANGTTIWVDKGVEDGGYTQGALLTVRDPVDDPVLDTGCLPGHDFIGWRVGGKGQVYQVASTLEMPGASAQLEVSGEPHLYAFCLSPIESSQLVTVRYASNTGSGTASGADVDGDGIDDRSFLMVRGNNVNTLTQAEAVGFTRTGYKLAGWKTVASDPDGEYPLYPLGGEYITGKGVQTLYAVWEELQAAITYEVANRDQGTVQLTGASGDGKALVHEAVGLITGQPVGAVATAAENYTFAGWYRDGILITTDPVLVPQRADEAEMWADAKYVAVFDTTIQVTFIILYPAGTETVVKAVAYGMPAAAPHITVPEGYTWLGWDKAFDRVTEDITVTGSFAVKQYTVRFVDHDGTLLSEQTVAHGANATAPPDPTWSGHVFSGWDRSFARVVKDLTVTALYDRTVYTVKFVDHDAKVLAEQKVPQGAEATAPDDPSWAGHKFLGWDKDFSNITSDLTVVALYDEVFYTVKFVDHDGKVLSSQQVVEGGAAKAPANPTWTGHTFSGWDKDFSNITGDLTVTALYDQVLHKVTFVDHDGTVLKVHQVPHGGAAAAPDEPTREGHEFAGWDKDFSVVTADLLVTALYRPLSDATDDPTGDPTDQPSGGQPGPTPTGGYSWTGTSLPFTGSNSTGLLLIGFGILLLGGTLRWVSLGRRRETRPPRP
ncbi:MAG: InlB B-repeat-containing protein, partial [Bifidobacteriaceae bacterium]|nr:InlB B-repeat-containing protein [Bifidobacteriaceae bacterium]